MAAGVYQGSRNDLAERTKEVWDDEEDVQEAVRRLIPKQSSADEQGQGLLYTAINELYIKQKFPEGYLGPLELRYNEGNSPDALYNRCQGVC